jgi:hypothetical protein
MRSWLTQGLWLVAAAGLVAAGGAIQRPLDERGRRFGLNAIDRQVAQTHPWVALANIAPGGLRAPIVDYLWIRAEKLKNAGRYFDAMQLADLICTLQPRFPGVWSFHSWNMAWNISVATQTPEERWLWVSNGMKLLRDKGLAYNPQSLLLYKDLAWVFFSKMGQNLDDMHMIYKRRWAGQMQRLLGAPPTGETSEVIDAFRAIAEAPLDRNPARQGRQTIQPDQLAVLLSDPNTADYAGQLASFGVRVDEGLLDVYNRFSLDEAANIVRYQPPAPRTPEERSLSDLINSPAHAQARNKLLAFVRAQVLWNTYKMDPRWMLGLMEKYDAPLDWRLVWPHALYWVSYGMHVCQDVDLAGITSLNTDRVAFASLQAMSWNGRMTYMDNPENPDLPMITLWSDWRYIDSVHREWLAMIEEFCKARGEKFENSILKPGHINYLVAAIQMLYVQNRYEKAQEYLDWIRTRYKMAGDIWDLDLGDFVVQSLTDNDTPTMDVTRSQLTAAMEMAFYFLALGDQAAYRDNARYAQRLYQAYQKASQFQRIKMVDFQTLAGVIAWQMVVEPRAVGLNLSLITRVNLYARLERQTRLFAFDRLSGSRELRRLCQAENLDFDQAFPAPEGIEEYRKQQRRTLLPTAPPTP